MMAFNLNNNHNGLTTLIIFHHHHPRPGLMTYFGDSFLLPSSSLFRMAFHHHKFSFVASHQQKFHHNCHLSLWWLCIIISRPFAIPIYSFSSSISSNHPLHEHFSLNMMTINTPPTHHSRETLLFHLYWDFAKMKLCRGECMRMLGGLLSEMLTSFQEIRAGNSGNAELEEQIAEKSFRKGSKIIIIHRSQVSQLPWMFLRQVDCWLAKQALEI